MCKKYGPKTQGQKYPYSSLRNTQKKQRWGLRERYGILTKAWNWFIIKHDTFSTERSGKAVQMHFSCRTHFQTAAGVEYPGRLFMLLWRHTHVQTDTHVLRDAYSAWSSVRIRARNKTLSHTQRHHSTHPVLLV